MCRARQLRIFLWLLALAACGIKGLPRPPYGEPSSETRASPSGTGPDTVDHCATGTCPDAGIR